MRRGYRRLGRRHRHAAQCVSLLHGELGLSCLATTTLDTSPDAIPNASLRLVPGSRETPNALAITPADWPTYRANIARTGSTTVKVTAAMPNSGGDGRRPSRWNRAFATEDSHGLLDINHHESAICGNSVNRRGRQDLDWQCRWCCPLP